MSIVSSPLIKRPLITGSAIVWFASAAFAQSMSVVETDNTIVVWRGDQAIVTYNKVSPPVPGGIDPVYQRSGCLHPVNSPRGRTVTQMFPADHPHQHGVFSAWVKTTFDGRPVDFWNLAKGTGRVLHERVVSIFQRTDAVGFEVDLIHRATNPRPVDVLRERWKITVHPTDGTYHCFDLETRQSAIADKPLIVDEHHYGGIALRGPTSWLTAKDDYASNHPDLVRQPSDFLNDLGSHRVKGNLEHARWVALTGRIDSAPTTIVVLCHPDNFRAPQAARLHPTKPYFCFAPCVDGTFTIDRDHPFQGRYRYLVTDVAPDAKWIGQQWATWCGQSSDVAP